MKIVVGLLILLVLHAVGWGSSGGGRGEGRRFLSRGDRDGGFVLALLVNRNDEGERWI